MTRAQTTPMQPYVYDESDGRYELPGRPDLPYVVNGGGGPGPVPDYPVRMGPGTEPWRIPPDSEASHYDGLDSTVPVFDIKNFGGTGGAADLDAILIAMTSSMTKQSYVLCDYGTYRIPRIKTLSANDFRGMYDHGTKIQGFIGRPRIYDSFGQVINETIFLLEGTAISSNAEALAYVTSRVAPQLNHTVVGYFSNNAQTKPLFFSGITFDAEPQKPYTAFTTAAQVAFKTNRTAPAPMSLAGLSLVKPIAGSVVQYCRFRGFSATYTSAPPYEMGTINTQLSTGLTIRNSEVDGRAAAYLDPLRTRVGGGIMQNKESNIRLENVYLHHTRRSGNALNTNTNNPNDVYYYENMQQHDIANITASDPFPSEITTFPGGFNNWNVEAVVGRVYIYNCFSNSQHSHVNWVVPYQGSSGNFYQVPDHTVFFVHGHRTTDTQYGGCTRFNIGGKGSNPAYPVWAHLVAVGIDASNLFDVRWNVGDADRMSGVRASVWTARQNAFGDAATFYPKQQYFVVDY